MGDYSLLPLLHSRVLNHHRSAANGNHDSQTSAVQGVFNTTELREMILAFLPLPSLLRAQAVNSHWKSLIQDSMQLQQQLFFKPEKEDKIWLVEITNLPSQQRPLPRRYASSLRVLAQTSRQHEVLKDHHGLIVTPVTVNPLFLHPDPMVKDPADVDKKVDRGYIGEYWLSHRLLRTITQHTMRDMLLTQPPVTNLCVEVTVVRRPEEDIAVGLTFPGSEDWLLFCAKVIEPDGIRLHHVVSAVKKLGVLERAEDIKLFMCGVVEPSEGDMKEVRSRTTAWQQAREIQSCD